MTKITVIGMAEEQVPADQATVRVTASFRAPTRNVALQAAIAAHARAAERGRKLVASGAARQYSTDPVSTYSNSWRDERGQQLVEHQANACVSIVFVDLDRVGEVAAELAEDGADVQVTWELSPKLRAERTRRLRRAAVEDARTAANDFAEAISATSLTMRSLRDGGAAAAGRCSPALVQMSAPTPEVTVGELSVSVCVEAVFVAE